MSLCTLDMTVDKNSFALLQDREIAKFIFYIHVPKLQDNAKFLMNLSIRALFYASDGIVLLFSFFLSSGIFKVTIWEILGMLVLAAGITAYVLGGGLPKSAQTTPVLWFFNLTILFIVLGIVITIVSFAGCIGSLRENTFLLKFYSYILIIMFLGECTLAILGFVYKEAAKDKMEDFMLNAFTKQYWEIGFEDTTNLVDTLQKELSCCGSKSYSDYNINSYYKCNTTVNKSPTACGVPYSCCRVMNDIDSRIINTACGYNVQSLLLPEVTKTVWTTGCVTAIANFIETNVVPILGVTIAIAFIQLIAAFLSRVLATQIHEQRKLLKRMVPLNHE